jgi:hypothetical protein
MFKLTVNNKMSTDNKKYERLNITQCTIKYVLVCRTT